MDKGRQTDRKEEGEQRGRGGGRRRRREKRCRHRLANTQTNQ